MRKRAPHPILDRSGRDANKLKDLNAGQKRGNASDRRSYYKERKEETTGQERSKEKKRESDGVLIKYQISLSIPTAVPGIM